jgi:hypothetical protein
MNFLELQDAVLTDRFGEDKRASAKRWINYRYGRLWSTEDWSFKRAVGTVLIPYGSSEVSMGDFQRILGLWDSTIAPSDTSLEAYRPEDFYGNHSTVSGTPYGFTVVGNSIRTNQPVSSNRTLTAVGELAFIPLVADGDEPLLPEEFHMTIVSGAIAQGLREENDPTWDAMEKDFQAGVADLKMGYLTQVRSYSDHSPAWP